MSEIVEGLGTAERERITVLRKGERFFWVDVSLGDTSRPHLGGRPRDRRDTLRYTIPMMI